MIGVASERCPRGSGSSRDVSDYIGQLNGVSFDS